MSAAHIRRRKLTNFGHNHRDSPWQPEAEEIEVADQESGDQHGHPAEPEQAFEHGPASGILDVPNDAHHGPPLPVQEHQ